MDIRELPGEEGLAESVAVIREAFSTVAARFALTPENTPSHPAFSTMDGLEALRGRGARFFGLFDGGSQAGFVAVEPAGEGLYYLERLAVLPDLRGRGYGRALVRFAFDHVSASGGGRISIAVIDADEGLKGWYEGLGFRLKDSKGFPQLPFRVRFMEKEIRASRPSPPS